MKQFYVYILANKNNTVLYTGVTSDILQRIFQHKKGFVEGFTKKYNVKKLVYFEEHDTFDVAVEREKKIKRWKKEWKKNLIKEENPEWRDLYEEIDFST